MFEFYSILSIICEVFSLFLAFYFKNTKIFFLSFCLIQARFVYFYTSVFQAHLFNSLFLPLIFWFFCLRKDTKLILDKKNMSAVLVLILMGILGIFLAQNTNFNSSILGFHFLNLNFFKPINELGFVFFVFMALILAVKCLRTREFYLLPAFFGMYLEFLFENAFKFFEFASFIFVFHLLHGIYRNAFFDSLTLLPNVKNLNRFVRGKEYYVMALLHFDELEQTQEAYTKLILKKIAKILRRFRAKIFIVGYDFILVFRDKNTALNHLAYLESLLRNTEFKLEDESFKLEFRIIWQENKETLEESIQSLKKGLS